MWLNNQKTGSRAEIFEPIRGRLCFRAILRVEKVEIIFVDTPRFRKKFPIYNDPERDFSKINEQNTKTLNSLNPDTHDLDFVRSAPLN